MPPLRVINALETGRALEALGTASVDVVRRVYLDYAAGRVHEAPHSFLHLPSDARATRGIALPAAIVGSALFGLKWICSSPTNVDCDLPRASGLVVLSDSDSGQPVAVLPAGEISAVRTAASATVAIEAAGLKDIRSCRIIGGGQLSRAILTLLSRRALVGAGTRVCVSDIRPRRAAAFAADASANLDLGAVTVESFTDTPCELMIIATSSQEPHIAHNAVTMVDDLILHLSLRDLAPASMAGLEHWTDVRELALGESTSLGLAVEDKIVDTSDVTELGEVLAGRGRLSQLDGRVICFSPFGLGALDLALGIEVYNRVVSDGGGQIVDQFEFGG
jgi:N-[(2S)-2-amino-2-carboxyethyl]-L-glutamate dehydrogenase